jgi:nitrogen fixation NifU-like protein
MSAELQELYQEVILDHNRRPRNFRAIEGGRRAEGYNPLCGDRITVHVCLEGDVIRDVSFQGSGCAISKASASLMTMALKGKNQEEALALFGRVHVLLTDGPNGAVKPEDVGKLAALSGVWEFPMRVKCATLAWHTLRSALEAQGERVSTE